MGFTRRIKAHKLFDEVHEEVHDDGDRRLKSLNDSSYSFVFRRMEKNRISLFSLVFTSLRFRWLCVRCHFPLWLSLALFTVHLYC